MENSVLIREITASPHEFARGVLAGFPEVRATPTGWYIHWQSAAAEIELAPLPALVIASLRLPRQRCIIRLQGADAVAREALLARLDQYQQRGGG